MTWLFVNWWPEDHFEYEWHFSQNQIHALATQGIAIDRMSGSALAEPWTPTGLAHRVAFVVRLLRRARAADVLLCYMDSYPTRVAAVLHAVGLLRRPKMVMTDFWLKMPPTSGKSVREHLKGIFLRRFYGRFDLILFDTRPGLAAYRQRGLLGPNVRTAYAPTLAADHKLAYLAEVAATIPTDAADGDYFFSVGNSQRDFLTVYEAAEQVPEQSFVVMTKSPPRRPAPANVSLARWGPYDEYLSYLVHAKAVIIPLFPGFHAAGLRALFEVWGLGRPAIIAATEAMRPYLPGDGRVALTYTPADAGSLARVVRAARSDAMRADLEAMGKRAQSYVRDEMNSSTYIRWLVTHLAGIVDSPRAEPGIASAGGIVEH